MYRNEVKAKDDLQSYTIYGDISGTSFDETNVLKGSLSFSNQCCDTSDFAYGGVYIGQISSSAEHRL